MKRFALLLALLICMALPACAEVLPCWPEPQLLKTDSTWSRVLDVYAHPTYMNLRTGRVSLSGDVWCYGYIESDDWVSLLVRYQKNDGGERIGWVQHVLPEQISGQGLQELAVSIGEPIEMTGFAVTDDLTANGATLGRIVGKGYVVAQLDDDWLCVSGPCETALGDSMVLAFAHQSAVAYQQAINALPEKAEPPLLTVTGTEKLRFPDDSDPVFSGALAQWVDIHGGTCRLAVSPEEDGQRPRTVSGRSIMLYPTNTAWVLCLADADSGEFTAPPVEIPLSSMVGCLYPIAVDPAGNLHLLYQRNLDASFLAVTPEGQLYSTLPDVGLEVVWFNATAEGFEAIVYDGQASELLTCSFTAK